ncbi:hypothetical protein ACRTC9_21610 [Vibrio vulnificus]|uniref:hypothetical protein n=1 Tax=Vibrio vulnificus TaxID=672 RepID=UPI0010288FDF|nr:hypothetical protein [Vibrio vulnificus]ELA3113525.1 hypothetical protein [Vibrio vulnificus]ELB7531381.1 hypothetical protein [Vibrio vulnificus]ELK2279467.1 hypothetical protein [Vibrio vulnificus]MCA3971214.1 hypothetical protein [Vibrio vulnificus]MCU8514637.1 hypothetical protein [Vibrio vulnificus]
MNKKLLVGGCLLGVTALFFVGKRGGEELSLPVCDSVPKIDTPVHFFTDDSISEARIEEFIDYSNLVLENSCIPIRRTLSGITKLDLTSFKSQDSGKLHQQLLLNVGNSLLESMQKVGSYYVLVLPKDFPFAKDSAGTAHVNFSRSFLVLSSDAELHVLEHELGHLAWAWHDNTAIHWLKGQLLKEHHKQIKPYAFGALCHEAGTVMTYAEKPLPVYSSPDIKYYGQACGNAETADNARHMREFALSLIAP